MLWEKIRGFHSSNFNNLKNIQKQNKVKIKSLTLQDGATKIWKTKNTETKLNIYKKYHHFILEFKLQLRTQIKSSICSQFMNSAGNKIKVIK